MRIVFYVFLAILSFDSLSQQDSSTAILWAIPSNSEHRMEKKEIIGVWQIASTDSAPSSVWCSMYVSVKVNENKARLLHKKVITDKINAGKSLLADLSENNKLKINVENHQFKLQQKLTKIDKYIYLFECHKNEAGHDLAHILDID